MRRLMPTRQRNLQSTPGLLRPTIRRSKGAALAAARARAAAETPRRSPSFGLGSPGFRFAGVSAGFAPPGKIEPLSCAANARPAVPAPSRRSSASRRYDSPVVRAHRLGCLHEPRLDLPFRHSEMRSGQRVLVAIPWLATLAGCSAGPNLSGNTSIACRPLTVTTSHRSADWGGTVFTIVMENHSRDQILGNPAAPFINGLAPGNAVAAGYHDSYEGPAG